MSALGKRQIPTIIAAVLTVFMLLDFFLAVPILRAVSNDIQTWTVVISAFAMGLGVVILVRNNVRIIRRRERNWPFHAWGLILLSVMIVLGQIGPQATHPSYVWLFTNAVVPLTGTMYTLLAFYVATAAYRAFRARNIDTVLVLVSGLFALMTMAPIGAAIWGGFPIIGNWFLNVANMAGMRGIIIGIGIGVVTLGIRTILGYERAHLGSGAGRTGEA